MASRGPDLAKQDLAKQAKLFVDTDAGVDDMLALFILMTGFLPSETDVAVTFGNVPVDQAKVTWLFLVSFRALRRADYCAAVLGPSLASRNLRRMSTGTMDLVE